MMKEISQAVLLISGWGSVILGMGRVSRNGYGEPEAFCLFALGCVMLIVYAIMELKEK